MTFIELKNLKTPSMVMVALSFDEKNKDELIKEMNAFFTQELQLFNEGCKITSIEKVSDNVKGKEGRTDVVLHLSEFNVNPLARLRFPDVKLTEDFLANYASDYISGDDYAN